MRRLAFLALFAFALPAAAQPTTYTLASAPYALTVDFTAPCATAPCANFTPGSQPSGSFTTDNPLVPNLVDANILANVTAFSFSDGITTYASANGDTRVIAFIVSTNGSGTVIGSNIQFQRWLTGSAPHGASDRVAILSISPGFFVSMTHNYNCTAVGVSAAGTADSCVTGAIDASSSNATSTVAAFTHPQPPQPPSIAAQPVPTVSSYALALLALMLATVAWTQRRKHQ